MWFESKIDSAPAELPIEGWEPEFPAEMAPVSAGDLPVEALPTSSDALAHMSPLADPGLAASMAGGAIFSEPVQWLLVTAAGLFCAAVGQAVVISPISHSAESNVEQTVSAELKSAAGEPSVVAEVKKVSPAAISPAVASVVDRTETAVESKDQSIGIVERANSPMLPTVSGQQVKPASSADAAPASTGHVARKAGVATTTAKKVATAPSPCVNVSRARRFGSRR